MYSKSYDLNSKMDKNQLNTVQIVLADMSRSEPFHIHMMIRNI